MSAAGRPPLVRLSRVQDALPVTVRHLRRLRSAGRVDWVHQTPDGLAVDWPSMRDWALWRHGIDVDQRAKRLLPAALAAELAAIDIHTKN
jgi:hypothetical protein